MSKVDYNKVINIKILDDESLDNILWRCEFRNAIF